MSRPTEAETNQAMSSEDMDVPMTDVSQEATLEEKPSSKPDRSEKFRKRIVDIFNRFPELSNREFLPVIIRDGQPIKDERYRINHTDGKIMLNGEQVPSGAEILNNINWELTYSAIKDKLTALDAAYKKVDNMASETRSEHPLKALFEVWKGNTNFTKHGADFAKQLSEMDDDDQRALIDYQMDSLTEREMDEFFKWRNQRTKRALEDSAVSLDTRVNKKTSDHDQMQKKTSVEYLYQKIDGLDSLKIIPLIKGSTRPGSVKRSGQVYFGPDAALYSLKTDRPYGAKSMTRINNAINWEATLTMVIDEIGTGVRALNMAAGKDKDAQKQANTYKEIKHILDVLKTVDAQQGQEQEDLSKFPPSSFQTPERTTQKSSKSITVQKEKEKDFTYEPPAGKGLTGRGLRGAGLKKNRSYNLADIEGSGKASDLKYKRIGTKFIRKEDLNNNRLKLVFPNRTSVGPIRAMSNELTAMVKDLLYNDNISQQAYRALPIEDQRVFYEIVKKTHVQHTLQTPIEDPRLTLKAEFDKLRGEIQLGNDNPDMLRELYRLATDMFEQKMISSSEFKSIMSALL